MTMFSKDEEKEHARQRILAWVKTRPVQEQALYCYHGRYVGYKKSLSFMCAGCKEENGS